MVGKVRESIRLLSDCEGGQSVVSRDAVVYGEEKDVAIYGVANISNHFAAQGIEIVGMTFVIHLPMHAFASRIKTMSREIQRVCKEQNIPVIDIHATRNPVITTTMVSVVGYGKCSKEEKEEEVCLEESTVLLVNEVALEGGLRLLDMKKEMVEGRFPSRFFEKYQEKKKKLFLYEELKVCNQLTGAKCFALGEGGIQAIFTHLCDTYKVGIDIDMKSIAINQETIELCEFMGLNPYKLHSTGAAVVVTAEAEACIEVLQSKGIGVSVIGRTTKELDKVVRKGDEKAFLERPSEDDFFKIFTT